MTIAMHINEAVFSYRYFECCDSAWYKRRTKMQRKSEFVQSANTQQLQHVQTCKYTYLYKASKFIRRRNHQLPKILIWLTVFTDRFVRRSLRCCLRSSKGDATTPTKPAILGKLRICSSGVRQHWIQHWCYVLLGSQWSHINDLRRQHRL